MSGSISILNFSIRRTTIFIIGMRTIRGYNSGMRTRHGNLGLSQQRPKNRLMRMSIWTLGLRCEPSALPSGPLSGPCPRGLRTVRGSLAGMRTTRGKHKGAFIQRYHLEDSTLYRSGLYGLRNYHFQLRDMEPHLEKQKHGSFRLPTVRGL